MEASSHPWDWAAEPKKRSLEEMTQLIASEICGDGHVAVAWKYAERALACGLASPMLLFSLLSIRIIPNRVLRPSAYRLYLELLLRHGFSFSSEIKAPNFKRIMVLIDENLNLSKIFGLQIYDKGVFIMLYIICIIWQLINASLDDEGLFELIINDDREPLWPIRPHDFDIIQGDYNKTEKNEKLQPINTSIAIEIIGHFLSNKVIYNLLSLAQLNMPSQMESLINSLHILSTNSLSLRTSPKSLNTITNFIQGNISQEINPKRLKTIHKKNRNLILNNSSSSNCWIPIDLYLEDCVDGSVASTNSIEILSGLLKSLQAINKSTWSDAFLALWIASLRLVQREREPVEGPVPHLYTRLSMLLSITPLSISNIIQENNNNNQENQDNNNGINMRNNLMTSLQVLGDYESLLVPPFSVVFNANQAAYKAVNFVNGGNLNEMGIIFSGNMRHLIVESCISRGLLDTSAYFWPGYIKNNNDLINHIPNNSVSNNQISNWHNFMRGAPLNQSLVNVLVTTPASSLAELKKIYEVAINGSEEDKVNAATILCGATLISGWNIQEHTVNFVIKLLSPPIPVNYTDTESHLINHGAMLNAILTGISSVDCVKVFSFHGMVPELAASLMPICETFGSHSPPSENNNKIISPHIIFSNAFILLMRLWKFNHPSLEYCIMGEAAPVGSQLTPEYLLLLRNNKKTNSNNNQNVNNNGDGDDGENDDFGHVYMDLFPKLKVWYRQHQACLASTLSGLINNTPVRKNVDGILNMMFRRINRSGSLTSSYSNNTGSDDVNNVNNNMCYDWPKLPAWDIMEAVPFVADSALAACSHGKLSPRELATGLKDLADYLPASLASIISYFSAEVTRGVWKPAFMNGTDWPSPAANLSMVEEQIKKIVGATGVNVPSLVTGTNSPATLPLPLAAFVSLTITYKLDKSSQLFLNLGGPALENLAVSCPWPSMPIVAALWTQKVKRWSDFLIFSASRTVFHHDMGAVVQLLRSCFQAAGFGGVGSLLGHGFGSHSSGGFSPVAPGILYLRSFRCIKNCVILAEEILSLLMLSIKEISQTLTLKSNLTKKTTHKPLHNQSSLHFAMARVKDVASLSATIIWLSGGSGLVQTLIQEILPSWFLSMQNLNQGGENGRLVYHLGGHALAYLTVYSGMFAWGIETTALSKRRQRVLRSHFEFLGRALEGRISIGCDLGLWREYVLGFLELVGECAPCWVGDVGFEGLKRVTNGLRRWGEEELALDLLRKGGKETMGLACELILDSRL